MRRVARASGSISAAKRLDRRPPLRQRRDLGQHRADFAYAKLREAIYSGKLRSGDRLREIELSEWLGVSRTPTREALRRLESEGLCGRSARGGLVVTELDSQQILELYSLREALEGMAAGLAARHASETEISSLRALLAEQRATPTDADRLAALNRQFHEVLYHAARNRYLLQALESLRDSLALLRETTYAVTGRPGSALIEHQRIIDAIKKQDAAAAEDAARKHIQAASNARLVLVLQAGRIQEAAPTLAT